MSNVRYSYQFWIKLEFSQLILKKTQTIMEISEVVAKMFHADRRTDRHDEAIVGFRNFVKAPNEATETGREFFKYNRVKLQDLRFLKKFCWRFTSSGM
jgi:hypothetical protein